MNRIAILSDEERRDLAQKYKTLIEELDITNNTKKINEIQTILNSRGIAINSRKWRTICEDIIHLFIYEEIDFLVVGDANGYKATNKVEDFEAFLKKKHHQFISLSANYWALKKYFRNSKNYSLDLGEEDMVNNTQTPKNTILSSIQEVRDSLTIKEAETPVEAVLVLTIGTDLSIGVIPNGNFNMLAIVTGTNAFKKLAENLHTQLKNAVAKNDSEVLALIDSAIEKINKSIEGSNKE